MAIRMGGILPMFHGFSEYLRSNSADYTVTYGTSTQNSLATIRRALIWNFGMAIVWIWVLPFVWSQFRRSWNARNALLVFAALLPALLFHSLVHVRDIDQTLISLPLICAIGGVAIASIPSKNLLIAATVLAVAASYWSFRRSFYPEMQAASSRAIRYVDDWTRSTYDALNQAKQQGRTVLVWYDEVVPWRNVSYYYPDLPVLVLSDSPFWSVSHKPGYTAERKDGALLVPAADQLIFGLSYERANQAANDWPGAERIGPLIRMRMKPGETLLVGSQRIVQGE